MPKFDVRKSIEIGVPVDKVYAAAGNFREWPRWSPWLIAEPECEVQYAEDGRSYSWNGKIVGAGEMAIVGEEPSRAIHYQLTFLKPWKSVSAVSFLFEEAGSGTRATWTMAGSLPFFMFWMKPMMGALIGMDYARGLAMLKDLLETGSVPSALEFRGRESVSGFDFVGIRTRCSMADIGSRMDADFEKLRTWMKRAGEEPSGKPVSIYHRWELVKQMTEYTIGFPVKNPRSDLPDGYVSGRVPSCAVYSVRHTGPYRHLGNAWSAGMMHGRGKMFRQDKRIDPFETYETEPGAVDENESVTTVHFPIKDK